MSWASDLVDITEEQEAIVEAVRDFVENEVYPVADEMEQRDEFPDKIVEQLKEMGLFGLTVPEEFGGAGMDLMTYSLVVVELARGWMSLSGVLNTHFMACYLINKFGTDDQKQRFLPRLATGEIRESLAMFKRSAAKPLVLVTTTSSTVRRCG
jgi:alkylation response protein AidB-like acyl-CoA dehydrogenase